MQASLAKLGALKHRLKHAKPACIGHVAICDIEHVRYILPYKRAYMRLVGAKIPARSKKAPSRKGNSAPDVGPSSPTPRRHSVISPALRFWDTRSIVLLRAVYRTRVPSRGPGESIVGAGGLARNSSWLKAKATARSAGGTGSACSKNIVGLRPPYFSAPTSGAESPPGNRFWDTRHDSPHLSGYRTRVPSRDPDLSLRDEMQNPRETAKAVAVCYRSTRIMKTGVPRALE